MRTPWFTVTLASLACFIVAAVCPAAPGPSSKQPAAKKAGAKAPAGERAGVGEEADAEGESGDAEDDGKKQVGNIRYSVPTGWEETEKDRLVLLTPPGEDATKCAIVLTPGETLEGDFLQWFKAKWKSLSKGARVAQGGEVTSQDGPDGSSVLYEAAIIEGPKKRQTGLLLYAANVGSGVYWAVFRADGIKPFNEHKKTAMEFLAGLRFVETMTEEEPVAGERESKASDGSGDAGTHKAAKPSKPVKPVKRAAPSKAKGAP